jgi:uncharacterized HhH-GPD family protein
VRGTLAVTGDTAADRLLNTDPLALLIAMLLDQQIAIELAFIGPSRLAERLGGHLDAARISDMDPDEFAAIVRTKPALHRFPASMAGRIQAMCRHLVDEYDGDAAAIWRRVRSAETLRARLEAIPGFGPEKVKIFTAVLAKRFGRRPTGWERVAGVFADDQMRSVADLDSPAAVTALRDRRRALKAAGRSKAD